VSNSDYKQAQKGIQQALPYLVENGIVRSCINCEHFRSRDDLGYCDVAKQTPPPKVIFYGCPAWEMEIPF